MNEYEYGIYGNSEPAKTISEETLLILEKMDSIILLLKAIEEKLAVAEKVCNVPEMDVEIQPTNRNWYDY